MSKNSPLTQHLMVLISKDTQDRGCVAKQWEAVVSSPVQKEDFENRRKSPSGI
jgi:hypothetical protein